MSHMLVHLGRNFPPSTEGENLLPARGSKISAFTERTLSLKSKMAIDRQDASQAQQRGISSL